MNDMFQPCEAISEEELKEYSARVPKIREEIKSLFPNAKITERIDKQRQTIEFDNCCESSQNTTEILFGEYNIGDRYWQVSTHLQESGGLSGEPLVSVVDGCLNNQVEYYEYILEKAKETYIKFVATEKDE